MANKYVDILRVENFPTFKWVEQREGFYYKYQINWRVDKLERYQSDCKYFNNPGFVCPLSAYRSSSSFFFVNG